MPNFYFIDSNLIIGYVNKLDYHHFSSKILIDDLNERSTILLTSVEREVNLLIQKQMHGFFTQINSKIQNGLTQLSDIKQQWNYRNENFENYIFKLFSDADITNVSPSDVFSIQSIYYRELSKKFKNLTRNWIKYPHINQESQIKASVYYGRKKRLLASSFHRLDLEHICLGLYRANNLPNHDYTIFTSDKPWTNHSQNQLEPNFRIKVVLIKGYHIISGNPNRHIQKILKRVRDYRFCEVRAEGKKINIAANTCLLFKNKVLKNTRIVKISFSTKNDVNTRRLVSVIKILLFCL